MNELSELSELDVFVIICAIIGGMFLIGHFFGGNSQTFGAASGGGKRNKTMRCVTLAAIFVGALLLAGVVKNNLM